RGELALAYRVLRGHRRHLAGLVRQPHRGGVAAGVHLRVVGHLEPLIDHQPALPRGESEALHQRVRPHPTHHTRVRVGMCSPVESWTPSAVAFSTEVSRYSSTPRRRSTRLAVRESRSSSSGSTRGAMSTSSQRGGVLASGGSHRASVWVRSWPCAVTSVPV